MFKGTTIIAVKKNGITAIGGDGQVTFGNIVMKSTARKIRKLLGGKVLVGFAGSTADALTLFEKFEGYLEKNDGNLKRAAVELTKDWRTDKILRRLEAMLISCTKDDLLLLSGNGDVIEPDDNVVSIGSGSGYALSAAKALLNNTELSAEDVVKKSLEITAELCIYTNSNIIIETIN
ncbi:ATP-dependent protease subunit HslV [Candidatus Dependentiae bacterium]|nr:ATP-dependent protease subunit HslV [Candidatus Dependentiae bacterium]